MQAEHDQAAATQVNEQPLPARQDAPPSLERRIEALQVRGWEVVERDAGGVHMRFPKQWPWVGTGIFIGAPLVLCALTLALSSSLLLPIFFAALTFLGAAILVMDYRTRQERWRYLAANEEAATGESGAPVRPGTASET